MKKMKVKKVGVRRKTTLVLWILLVSSIAFGIYKNFTAIDRHTVHEEKIIDTKIVDTTFISSYVEDFVQAFYSWEPTPEALEARSERLKAYLTEELQVINQEMIRSDIPSKSSVAKIRIRKVDQLNEKKYQVTYTLSQLIEETVEEQTFSKIVESAYSVKIKTNNENQLVVISNPQMSALPSKLEVQTNPLQDDLEITQQTKDEVNEFLNTFFKVYPTAKQTELVYYCANSDIKEINKNYIFSDIRSINFFKGDKGVTVKLVVSYLDNDTKANLMFDYDLRLEKRSNNWIIVQGV
ncbi:conjugal transfer protein [Enterococcus faecalis]|nr:conjugal transfer protein [Enterococcus faecalis]